MILPEIITPTNKDDFFISKADFLQYGLDFSAQLPLWKGDSNQQFHQSDLWHGLWQSERVIIVWEEESRRCVWRSECSPIANPKVKCFPLQRLIRDMLSKPMPPSVSVEL